MLQYERSGTAAMTTVLVSGQLRYCYRIRPTGKRLRFEMNLIWRTIAIITLAAMLAPRPLQAAANNREGQAADTLERMARATFGSLSDAELRMIRTAPTRDIAWTSPVQDPEAPINDPAKAATWSKERTIRAGVIAWLLSDAEASKLIHPSGIGIAGARFEGKLDFSYLKVASPLTLVACSVPDGIDLSFGRFQSIDLRQCWTGPISADRAIVYGDVTLRQGQYDDVSFFRSEIDGTLDCSSGRFAGGNPLSMVETTIKGDALFHQGFTTGGTVDFRLARLEQSLSFNNAIFTGTGDNGLTAERAMIGGALYWVDTKITLHTQLDLSSAHAGSLWDDAKSWPAPGNLSLDGFVYGSFTGGPMDAKSRLEWLRRQPLTLQAEPQPYSQLAQVLGQTGAAESATLVEVAREDALTEYGGLSLASRLWRYTLRITIGYGYRPLLALWWILLFVSLGTVLFEWGYRARLITPTDESAYTTFVKTGTPPSHYPPFASFVYSLENFLPVVELHQGAYWRPNPHHTPARTGHLLRQGGERAPAMLLRWYLWVHILAGWTITPLLFAGLAGLLRNG
jgi:hypothetical protein